MRGMTEGNLGSIFDFQSIFMNLPYPLPNKCRKMLCFDKQDM